MKEKELIERLARKAGDTLMKHFRQDWDLLKIGARLRKRSPGTMKRWTG